MYNNYIYLYVHLCYIWAHTVPTCRNSKSICKSWAYLTKIISKRSHKWIKIESNQGRICCSQDENATKSLFRPWKYPQIIINYKCSKSIHSMVCRINYFPSLLTELCYRGQGNRNTEICTLRWSVLIWSLSPHLLREILRDSKSEMTFDSSDKLTFTCQMVQALPQNTP